MSDFTLKATDFMDTMGGLIERLQGRVELEFHGYAREEYCLLRSCRVFETVLDGADLC